VRTIGVDFGAAAAHEDSFCCMKRATSVLDRFGVRIALKYEKQIGSPDLVTPCANWVATRLPPLAGGEDCLAAVEL
jgi:hypothetical protein